MAVEARQQQFNPFPLWLLSSREFMMNGVEVIGSAYATPVEHAPFYGTAPMENVYGGATAPAVPAKIAALKSDRGLTYAFPGSRKRSRESFENCGSFNFLCEDLSSHLLQQQMEIDGFIAQHTERLKMDMKDRREKYSRRIAAIVQEHAMKKLKVKEEEIDKIGKLNLALEERVKSLFVENQILRELAQTNEATAHALRCNLEQVLLAQVQDEQQQYLHRDTVALADDAESCCDSSFEDANRTLTENHDHDYISNFNSQRNRPNGMCRSCGKAESSVLLLPCRHLCLCTVCVSGLHTCPICNSAKTAILDVNLSAS